MSFLNGAFLLGTLAIAVPIALHMIQRQRYPKRLFSTVRFFDKTIRHNVIQNHLVDRILLLLRVAMLLALIAAAARPFVNAGVGEKRMSMVMIVDNSPSMGRLTDDNRSLFSQAQEQALSMLSELSPTDRVAVLFTTPGAYVSYHRERSLLLAELVANPDVPFALLGRNDGESRTILPALTTDHAQLRDAIAKAPAGMELGLHRGDAAPPQVLSRAHEQAELRLRSVRISGVGGNMSDALRQAGKLLSDSRDGDRQIVIFSDLQRADWQDEVVDLTGIHVSCVTVAADAEQNLAIHDIQLPTSAVHYGSRVSGSVIIANHGSQASAAAILELQVSGQQKVDKTAVPAIPAGKQVAVPFHLNALASSSHLFASLRVVSPNDRFAYDDSHHFQLRIRQPLQILCVRDTNTGSVSQQATFFVRAALSPLNSNEIFAEVSDCSSKELVEKQLFEYDVIILADVTELSAEAVENVHRFSKDGGGLIVFPGLNTRPEVYNSWPFLPATVQNLERETFAFVKDLSVADPDMARLRARSTGAYQSLSSNIWVELQAKENAEVLATLANGKPAIVGHKPGKGAVVMAAAGCHSSSSDWPLRPVFVMLVHTLTDWVSQRHNHSEAIHRTVGTGASAQIPPNMQGGSASGFQLSFDSAITGYMPIPFRVANRFVRVNQLEHPGHYVLAVQPTAVEGVLEQPGLGAQLTPVAVNIAPSESKLATLDSDALTARLQAASVATMAATDGPLEVASLRNGREAWRLLAAGALLFFLLETVFGWIRISDTVKEARG